MALTNFSGEPSAVVTEAAFSWQHLGYLEVVYIYICMYMYMGVLKKSSPSE